MGSREISFSNKFSLGQKGQKNEGISTAMTIAAIAVALVMAFDFITVQSELCKIAEILQLGV